MPDPVTGTIAAVGGGSIFAGDRAASKAASAQSNAAQAQIDFMREQSDIARNLLEPFRMAGLQGLQGLQDLTSETGRASFLSDYYKGPEFAQQSSAARNQQLAAAEATGGLQSTSTQNQLARIAPTLGSQALMNQQNLLGNLTNVGLTGAGSQAGYAQQFGQMGAQALGDMGAAQAGRYLSQGQNIGSGLNLAGGLLLGSGLF